MKSDQLEALGTAILLVKKLPEDTVWAMTVTNDDDVESTSVLNIYIPKPEWRVYAAMLRLGSFIDLDKTFISFQQGTLTVSLIEENNER